MLTSYLKIAYRNLLKNKVFSFINIFGLSIGFTCTILILAFLYDELSYDNNPALAGQIYRVSCRVTTNGEPVDYSADAAVGAGIKNAFPEVLAFTRIANVGDTYIHYKDKLFKEQHLAFCDSNFLNMFSIPFIEGNPKTALVQPNSIVISKALAKKYFGDAPAMGELLPTTGLWGTLKVTGVIDKIPDNSHFHFDAFVSYTTNKFAMQMHTWSNNGFFTYLLLRPDADPQKLQAKLPMLMEKHVLPEVQRDMGIGVAEARKTLRDWQFVLLPLKKIHLYSNSRFELEANGDIRYVYIFGALASFILVLACINFTNLSTAGSSNRSKEMGVHKVLGAEKNQLVFQFLIQSIVLSICAMLLSMLFSLLLLPYLNQLSGKHISLAFLINYRSIIIAILLPFFVGLLAGIYPAFYLSSFKISNILKGKLFSWNGKRSYLRSGLVVFQFLISTILIIATLIIYRQLNYMQEKKLGYNPEQVLYVQDMQMLGDGKVRSAFKERVAQDSRIVHASMGMYVPGSENIGGSDIYAKEKKGNEDVHVVHSNIYNIDFEYAPALELRFASGRNFSRNFSTDSTAAIINEAEAQELGWNNEEAIGKTIISSNKQAFTVIGVVSNFHYTTVKQKIAPLMMVIGRTGPGLILNIKTTHVAGLLNDLEKIWKSFNEDAPFTYYFLDDKFASMYSSEQKTGKIFGTFAIIAVIIACLGLFGLTNYSAERRTKEIGIRKVFGASVLQMMILLLKEFLFLVGIAFVIAVPLAWFFMHSWLQNFAYRIQISIYFFAIAGLIILVISIATTGFYALKAAIANPSNSLRAETN